MKKKQTLWVSFLSEISKIQVQQSEYDYRFDIKQRFLQELLSKLLIINMIRKYYISPFEKITTFYGTKKGIAQIFSYFYFTYDLNKCFLKDFFTRQLQSISFHSSTIKSAFLLVLLSLALSISLCLFLLVVQINACFCCTQCDLMI